MSSGDRLVMISGCSGGGNSTLLEELARRGHAVVREPGRRIIAEEHTGDGRALPWVDPVALDASSGESTAELVARYRYNPLFLAPPWPEIYERDNDRRHDLPQALSDYEHVERAYLALGYTPVMLPHTGVAARADFVLAALA